MSADIDKPVLQARARLAFASKRGHDPAEAKAARANLATAKLERYIKQVIAEAPPLSEEALDRIALLLRPAPVKPATTRIKRVRGVVRNSGGGSA